MESKVIGVESSCLEGLVKYSIQAEDIRIYLCGFHGTFACFLSILLFSARHDVKWQPCISTLRSIDTMTQVCYEGTYFGAQHILDQANNSPFGLAYRVRHVGDLRRPQIMGSLGNPSIPKTGGVLATPKRYVGRV